MKKIIFFVLVALLVIIQVVPYGRNHENPVVQAEPDWDSQTTKALFDRACADCHSNQTKWPWYSHVAPFSWLVQYDVDEGREKFNVSMWGLQRKNRGDEAAETVSDGEMPPWFYVIPHPEAKLSPEETKKLIEGLANTFE